MRQMRQKSRSSSSTAASAIFLNFSSKRSRQDQVLLEPVDALQSPHRARLPLLGPLAFGDVSNHALHSGDLSAFEYPAGADFDEAAAAVLPNDLDFEQSLDAALQCCRRRSSLPGPRPPGSETSKNAGLLFLPT